jgi:predicted  nucleic acid-binding Zn-ribbon protein
MSINASMDQAIDRLIKLQGLDRIRDRLQRKLDQVPKKLKGHTDGIASLESQVAEQSVLARSAKIEADRVELEATSREDRRESIKAAMNAPKLSNREYEVLGTRSRESLRTSRP